ncbi:MAG: diacylglycerol/lipid kinase family protein [Candidatus Acidulodesulfobacterium sp.]
MNLKKVLIIYNPKSGRFSEKKLYYILNFFKHKNIFANILNILEASIEKEYIENSYDAVLVAGGDGSLNYVINTMVYSKIPIAHLPMGTVNLFAMENKTPHSLKKALPEIIETYKPVKISLGLANERFFFAMTGIGLDAFIVKNMEEKIRKNKKRIYNNFMKYVSYILNIIKMTKKYRFYDLCIKNSTEKITCAKEIIVSNIRYYGGPFKIFPNNSPLDDKFHIRTVQNAAGTIDVIFSILKSLIFYKKYSNNPDFYKKDDEIIITSMDDLTDKLIYYQCDGEFAGTLPVKIKKAKNAITMLINPNYFPLSHQ